MKVISKLLAYVSSYGFAVSTMYGIIHVLGDVALF